MKKAPSVYTLENLIEHCKSCRAHINNKWVPARPIGYFSLPHRINLAWKVFTGTYDALKWPENQ